ncbi:VOC family protein [Teichococcus oryzae]|jgi:catechol 2,3-dioxygenase-like lactoylglutathione lyase family enzyme|uniref:VOC family protein n=1 Tax=Teichococcus oryzae TaxID=1608942 RepID=A0A5B2TGI1_9PROT|nr:VOC family protein [Pseudoroseomonas oryzae]KAA2213289.1 VOC family protein [Pseudoroseomonas oryzae]
MIHHLSFGTSDIGRAAAFYDAVLAVVGLRRIRRDEAGVHYGTGDILFSLVRPVDGRPASPGNGAHVAFAAADRAMVDAFHRAALAHGGTEDGPPGLRPEYNAHYYGAFLRDPDGNKIEAVTHSAR